MKRNCLSYAASLWPTEVLEYLIDWHKRVLNVAPEPNGEFFIDLVPICFCNFLSL